jgi:hypothetical protein
MRREERNRGFSRKTYDSNGIPLIGGLLQSAGPPTLYTYNQNTPPLRCLFGCGTQVWSEIDSYANFIQSASLSHHLDHCHYFVDEA